MKGALSCYCPRDGCFLGAQLGSCEPYKQGRGLCQLPALQQGPPLRWGPGCSFLCFLLHSLVEEARKRNAPVPALGSERCRSAWAPVVGLSLGCRLPSNDMEIIVCILPCVVASLPFCTSDLFHALLAYPTLLSVPRSPSYSLLPNYCCLASY